LGFHADLRRECVWGNLDLMFFGVLVEFPRGPTEEGGNNGVFWGNLLCWWAATWVV
jgi:hypothetical protein